jgi:hypothetical protein
MRLNLNDRLRTPKKNYDMKRGKNIDYDDENCSVDLETESEGDSLIESEE